MKRDCGWLILLVLLVGCGGEPPTETAKPLQVATLLGGNADADAGFTRATAPVPLEFPRDHGPHPAYRSEWWYWTGNLKTAAGREFGFQFTVFRFALTAQATARPSAWAADSAWLAHLTVTDIATGRFVARERSARGAAGLAGATGEPFRVWCDGWEIGGSPWRLQADAGEIALDLTLEPGKAPVLQGDRGLSQKGAAPGNASIYYSLTRMPTTGTVRVGGERHAVSGSAWMDREWSTSALEPGVVGWDWFALQLADGRELMFYRLRRADGTATSFSAGSLVAADGTVTRLSAAEVTITSDQTWTSPRGTRYPARWRLRARDLDLLITPRVADQELDVSVRYWEGAVAVSGSVAGVGYVELAGY